jgi:hypothetical protein
VSRTVTPAVLVADVEYKGRSFSLALVRTHYASEGNAIVEETIELEGKPVTSFIDMGSWSIKRHDEGPATLGCEINVPDDIELPGKLGDVLLEELARIGSDWGIEAWEACS